MCTVTDVPHYGAVVIYNNAIDLDYKLPNTNNQEFALTLNTNEYGIVAYPAALGKAFFYDLTVGLGEGGWDGATWTPYAFDPTTHTTYEPVVITRNNTDWLVYRTDFPETGSRNWKIEFANAGLRVGEQAPCNTESYTRYDQFDMTLDTQDAVVYEEPVEETPVEETPVITGECVVSDYPRFGTRTTNFSSSDDVRSLTIKYPHTYNQNITLDQPNEKDYGFFAYPTALGKATFVDTDNNFEGGWDGATWPDDGTVVFDRYEPVVVYVDNTQWYLYRTDFSGLGRKTWNVKFENAGLELGAYGPCAEEGLNSFDVKNVIVGDKIELSDNAKIAITNVGERSNVIARGVIVGKEIAEVNLTALEDGMYDLFVTDTYLNQTIGPVTMQVVDGAFTQHIDISDPTIVRFKTEVSGTGLIKKMKITINYFADSIEKFFELVIIFFGR